MASDQPPTLDELRAEVDRLQASMMGATGKENRKTRKRLRARIALLRSKMPPEGVKAQPAGGMPGLAKLQPRDELELYRHVAAVLAGPPAACIQRAVRRFLPRHRPLAADRRTRAPHRSRGSRRRAAGARRAAAKHRLRMAGDAFWVRSLACLPVRDAIQLSASSRAPLAI